jgi:leucyl-tRNA synthetase
VVYLAPIAPHLAEECWHLLGRKGSLFEGASWPTEGADEIRRLLEGTKGRAHGESRDRLHADP